MRSKKKRDILKLKRKINIQNADPNYEVDSLLQDLRSLTELKLDDIQGSYKLVGQISLSLSTKDEQAVFGAFDEICEIGTFQVLGLLLHQSTQYENFELSVKILEILDDLSSISELSAGQISISLIHSNLITRIASLLDSTFDNPYIPQPPRHSILQLSLSIIQNVSILSEVPVTQLTKSTDVLKDIVIKGIDQMLICEGNVGNTNQIEMQDLEVIEEVAKFFAIEVEGIFSNENRQKE